MLRSLGLQTCPTNQMQHTLPRLARALSSKCSLEGAQCLSASVKASLQRKGRGQCACVRVLARARVGSRACASSGGHGQAVELSGKHRSCRPHSQHAAAHCHRQVLCMSLRAGAQRGCMQPPRPRPLPEALQYALISPVLASEPVSEKVPSCCSASANAVAFTAASLRKLHCWFGGQRLSTACCGP